MIGTTHTTSRREKLRLRRPGGFTLAELSIVVLLISIMAAVAVPRYSNALQNYQAEAAARRVKGDLEYLRNTARKASATRSVTFDVTGQSYTMTSVADLNRYSKSNYVVSLKTMPYKAKMNSANCGGDATLVFDGFGKPDSTATIVVASGSYTKSVTVESSAGVVTIQ